MAEEQANVPAEQKGAKENMPEIPQGGPDQLMAQDNPVLTFVERMDQLERIANKMAESGTMVPEHLRDNPGGCFGILCNALQWRVDPWALALKSYEVSGKISYESQVFGAVMRSCGYIESPLEAEYFGNWENILGNITWQPTQKGGKKPVAGWKPEDEKGVGITIWGTLKGESGPRTMTVYMRQCTVRNSTLWVSDPQQQLYYFAQRRWARRYCEDAVMGIYTKDEMEEMRPVEGQVIDADTGAQKKKEILGKAKEQSGQSEQPAEESNEEAEAVAEATVLDQETPPETEPESSDVDEGGNNTPQEPEPTNENEAATQEAQGEEQSSEATDSGPTPANLTKKEAAELMKVPEDVMMDFFKAYGYSTWSAVTKDLKQKIIDNPKNSAQKISAWQDKQQQEANE